MIRKRNILIIGIAVGIVMIIVLAAALLGSRTQTQPEPDTQDTTQITPGDSTDIPTDTLVDYTQPPSKESLERIEKSHRVFSPNIYLRNKLPEDQASFTMNFYIDEQRQAYVFTVTPKITSLQEVQQEVLNWLLSIGLSEDQINTLIIEYTQQVN